MEDIVKNITPLPITERSFQEWSRIFIQRQTERQQQSPLQEHIRIQVKTKKPILLAGFGDVHAGGDDVEYQRFTDELLLCADTPGVYVLTLGDLTDSFFWGGESQDENIASFAEQNEFIKTGLKLLAKKHRLLACWGGDHDLWATRMGESMYAKFAKEMNAFYLHGVSYISLYVGDMQYRISGAHRHNGFSIYNKAHASVRLYRDSAEGSDIVLTAHYHRKAYIAQPTKKFGGIDTLVHYMSIGAYKRSDSYLRKKGYARLGDNEIGPYGIILYPDEKKVEVYNTIFEGVKRLKRLRR